MIFFRNLSHFIEDHLISMHYMWESLDMTSISKKRDLLGNILLIVYSPFVINKLYWTILITECKAVSNSDPILVCNSGFWLTI